MRIRRYEPSDCKDLAELFYNTVHSINARDYTEKQLNVWATGSVDLEKWNKSLLENFTVIGIENNITVGFGDIDESGYLIDYMFIRTTQIKGLLL